MKKTTSEKLSNRLLKYGAFSAAILGTANASGQIVYTDIADETVDGANPRYAIDLNNDATGDYLFGANGTNFAFIFPVSSSSASTFNSNLIVGFTSAPYNYPSNLSAGTIIDAANPTFDGARGDFNYSSCGYPGSQFCDGMDGYVGFHFYVGANLHFGWARIQVDPSGGSIIVKDYAYESTPNTAIEAGQTLSTNEFALANSVYVTCKDKIVTISNLQGDASYNIYSLDGKSVLNGTTRLESQEINANNLASGIYIVEVIDASKNATARKKIVIE